MMNSILQTTFLSVMESERSFYYGKQKVKGRCDIECFILDQLVLTIEVKKHKDRDINQGIYQLAAGMLAQAFEKLRTGLYDKESSAIVAHGWRLIGQKFYSCVSEIKVSYLESVRKGEREGNYSIQQTFIGDFSNPTLKEPIIEFIVRTRKYWTEQIIKRRPKIAYGECLHDLCVLSSQYRVDTDSESDSTSNSIEEILIV